MYVEYCSEENEVITIFGEDHQSHLYRRQKDIPGRQQNFITQKDGEAFEAWRIDSAIRCGLSKYLATGS